MVFFSVVPMLRLVLVTFLICPLMFAMTCRSGQQEDVRASEEDGLFLSYRVGGGMDVYTDGDRYGHGIDIRFDGSYTLYRRLYQQRSGRDPSIVEEAIEEGELDQEGFVAVRSAVDSVDLSSIPRRLPDVNPQQVEVRGPAETVIFGVRPTPSAELVEIQADMGADREHYPRAFLELHTHLEALVRDRLDERGR